MRETLLGGVKLPLFFLLLSLSMLGSDHHVLMVTQYLLLVLGLILGSLVASPILRDRLWRKVIGCWGQPVYEPIVLLELAKEALFNASFVQ